MWQRIQTLYLAVASALLAAMYFASYRTAFVVLFSVALAAQVLALLTFRLRPLQMRLSTLAALILLGLQAWMAVSYFGSADKTSYDMTAVFPVVAAILDVLAVRGILADEFLVRSASRLRSAKRNKK